MSEEHDPDIKWIALMVCAMVLGCCFLVTSCEKRRFEVNERVRWISQDFSWSGYDGPVKKDAPKP